MHRLLLALLALLASLTALAQDDVTYRLELGAGVGLATSMNDCNGKLLGGGSVAASAVARFPLSPRMAVKTQLSYLRLSGDTRGVKNYYPALGPGGEAQPLSYSFSDGLVSLCGTYELHFLPYGWQRGYQGYRRLSPFLELGLGMVYAPGSKTFALSLPLGAGVKYKVAPRLNLALEWLFHFTGSDNLDGLEGPTGITSSGLRNKDHFGQLGLTLTYDLSPRCPTCNKAW